jgi:hypothetical protein
MDLGIIKHLRNWIPETYLLLSVIYYWVMTGTLLNAVAMLLLSVLIIFIWLRIRVLGVIISSVFLLLNLYMVLALVSELSEFSTFDKRAITLLLFGSVYLGLNIFLSTKMLIKWITKRHEITATS